jgi:hypothetical protein
LPICAVDDGGVLFTRYGRKYTELAVEECEGVEPLTPERIAALDLFDEITRTPGMSFDMTFRPGDLQFLDNTSTMHARTAFVDWPEPHRRRELLRIWLVVRTGCELPAVFRSAGFVPRTAVSTRRPAANDQL